MVEVAEKQDPNIRRLICEVCWWEGYKFDLKNGRCPNCGGDVIPLNIP